VRQHLACGFAIPDEVIVHEINACWTGFLRQDEIEFADQLLRRFHTRLASIQIGNIAEFAKIRTTVGGPWLQVHDACTRANREGMRSGFSYIFAVLRDAGHGESSLPAIALTAYSRMEDRAQALAAGFQEHLVKPLDPQLLIATVASLCSRR